MRKMSGRLPPSRRVLEKKVKLFGTSWMMPSVIAKAMPVKMPAVASETMKVGAWKRRARTAFTMLQMMATAMPASIASSSG